MIVNAVIAEYNPFHNGHKYHLENSRRLTGADHTIAVISGNFVQRGAPALVDKHTRTRMALRNGADLVLELPAVYATASAERFAAGAVALLEKLGVVTHLCFGSECGDLAALRRAALVLAREPEMFSAKLKTLLREGLSYPAARAEALTRCLPESEGIKELLSSPNNILGIEYVKAILRQNSAMEPITVKRIGPGYHDADTDRHGNHSGDTDYHGNYSGATGRPGNHSGDTDCFGNYSGATGCFGNHGDAAFCSAHALRQAIREGKPVSELSSWLPESAAALLSARLAEGAVLCEDDLSDILYYKLLQEKASGYRRYLDVSRELSDRIENRLPEYRGFRAFCNLLKTRELTYARISRCLLHIVLDLTKEDALLWERQDLIPYVRVLGFRRDAAGLLTALKAKASVPLVTKLADGEKLLPRDAVPLFRRELSISQLYLGLSAGKKGGIPANEYTVPLVIL